MRLNVTLLQESVPAAAAGHRRRRNTPGNAQATGLWQELTLESGRVATHRRGQVREDFTDSLR